MTKIIAVIPARGGSQRIKGKNIRDFCGQPIISWSIEAAKRTNLFDQVVVSTDEPKIAEIAKQMGADVPFVRPAELADEFTGVSPVVQHAIQQLTDAGIGISAACLIYATAPFVRASDLTLGYKKLIEHKCDYVLSVTEFSYPIQRALKTNEDGNLVMIQGEHFHSRSQDLSPAYHDTGQFCWGTAQAWREALPFFGNNTLPIILPHYLVQDIDTEEDWERATWMFKAMKLEQVV